MSELVLETFGGVRTLRTRLSTDKVIQNLDDILAIVDELCETYPELAKKSKKIGAGTYGKVYLLCRVPGVCKYAMKIQKQCGNEYHWRRLKAEMEHTNRVAAYGLAPTIYEIHQCRGNCVVVMDYIPYKTFHAMIRENTASNDFSMELIELFFDALEDLHKISPHGHGDPGFNNVMYDEENDRFIFIDLSGEKSNRPAIHDYAVLLWYLPSYLNNLSNANFILFYSRILREMKKMYCNDQWLWLDVDYSINETPVARLRQIELLINTFKNRKEIQDKDPTSDLDEDTKKSDLLLSMRDLRENVGRDFVVQ